ncbi:MAG: DUF444 family protein [Chitinispirillales bacterium]|jgi:uncharacterized sporulation protein YeaH/YhbH (DUF444 family)|nr:DUF444 family protein [Chitinispirillales bacterium]
MNNKKNDKFLNEQKRLQAMELEKTTCQDSHEPAKGSQAEQKAPPGLYTLNDSQVLNGLNNPSFTNAAGASTIDELLQRDQQREQDGFPRKIRVGRLFKPGRGASDSVVIVPSTVEEKLIHDSVSDPAQEGQAGGSGQGEEGEVIGEQPIRPEQQGDGNGAGQGGGSGHEMESSAYDLGRVLTQQFQLPNLKDRGTKRALTRFIYDITDKNRGFGQVLDKKATLRKVIETNIGLDRIADMADINTSEFLVSPKDKVYRVLSREKDYESQAMVFFLRDYSGSMAGKCTELVVAQHVLIYSWLLYQYAKRVETRFIVHDTEAKEVPDFYTYYNSKVAGGTQVSAGYEFINNIVEKENLAQEYNIFVFQGTDGDDWDAVGEKAIPELKKILSYASRVGVTIAEHSYSAGQKTEVQKYLEDSGLLSEFSDYLRMDVINEAAEESRLIEGIKHLLSTESVSQWS